MYVTFVVVKFCPFVIHDLSSDCYMTNMADVTSGTGTVYPSESPVIIPVFVGSLLCVFSFLLSVLWTVSLCLRHFVFVIVLSVLFCHCIVCSLLSLYCLFSFVIVLSVLFCHCIVCSLLSLYCLFSFKLRFLITLLYILTVFQAVKPVCFQYWFYLLSTVLPQRGWRYITQYNTNIIQWKLCFSTKDNSI